MIKGFKMKLYPGMEAEYEKRHNQLWPEMKDMIHEHGGKNYTIFLDRETLTLFGYIEIENEELWAKGADTAINRKWWDFSRMEPDPTFYADPTLPDILRQSMETLAPMYRLMIRAMEEELETREQEEPPIFPAWDPYKLEP